MNVVVTKSVEQITKTLNAVGAKYKIVMPDGSEYGALEVVVPKARTRKPLDFKRGTIKAVYESALNALEVGGTAAIECPDWLTTERLRGAITADCSTAWGKGNYVTAVVGNSIEVLRIG